MAGSIGHTATALLTTGGIAVLFGACAFPEFEFDRIGPGSVASTETTISSGGMAGMGGMTTTSTGGGMGGSLPTDCTLFTTGQCGPGRKCSIVDPVTGESGCIDAGGHPPWSRCEQDTDCGEGYYCPDGGGTCHLICGQKSDCGDPARDCAVAMHEGSPIPNFGLCTANCHPTTGSPCNNSRGAVNCVPTSVGNTSGLLDCAASDGKTFDQMCDTSRECALGLVCLVSTNACTFWCAPPDNTVNNICPTGAPSCKPTTPDVTHETITYGVCAN